MQHVRLNIYNRRITTMRILDSAIGWLAPPICIVCGSEGSVLCEVCASVEILTFGEKCWGCGIVSERAATCPRCRRSGSPRFVWITTDYESTAKALVSAYKFGHQRAAAKALSKLMVETFLQFNADKEIDMKDYLLIPLPTATSRVRQRSFDHTALMAREIGLELKLRISTCLRRLDQSRQLGAKRDVRASQLKNNLYIVNGFKIKGRNIVLLDDVITSGATITEAAKTLRWAGAKSVNSLVFAKKL